MPGYLPLRAPRSFLSRTMGLTLLTCSLVGVGLGVWALAADEPPAPAGVVATLTGHKEMIYSVAYSADGKFVATGSFDQTVKLWDAATGKEIKTFAGPAGHQKQVLSIAFSPDSQTIASGGQDNAAKIWDVPVAGHLREFVHADAVSSLALAPDGAKIAGAGKDGTIKIWNTADGKELVTLTGHTGPVLGVAFSGNGQSLASSGRDGTVRFWNVADGKPVAVVNAHGGAANAVMFHPSNSSAFSVGDDGMLKFWQLPIAGPRTLPPHDGAVTALFLSADGNQAFSAGADKSVQLSNFSNGQLVRRLTGPTAAIDAIAATYSLTAAGTVDQRLFVWNTADGKVLSQSIAHDGPVTGVAFAAQYNQLLTAGGDGLIKVWAMPPVPARTATHADAVLAATMSSDGKHLFTAGADKVLQSWNLANNQVQLDRKFEGHTAAITAVAVSANGQVLASGGADATIRFWNQANGKESALLGTGSGPVTALALHPSGMQVLSAGEDGAVKLWRLPVPPRSFIHPEAVTCAVLSSDGARLLTGCTDKQARLWNLSTGKMERLLAGHTLAVTSVALSANGSSAASGSADKSVILWSTSDGKQIKRLGGLPAAVQCVAFSPDGSLVAAGLADSSIHLLDVAKGQATRVLTGHSGAVAAVAFATSGDRLVSAAADKTVRWWNTADGSLQSRLDASAVVPCLALSRDGSKVAAGVDRAIQVWSSEGKELATITTPAEVVSVALNGDGSRVVAGGADNRARLYTMDGRLLEFFQHEGPVTAVAFHPDGKQILSGSSDKTARAFSMSLLWQGTHAGPVRRALFHPKGDQVFSAGDDKLIKIWSTTDGKEMQSIAAHDGAVTGLGISADATRLFSAGADSTLKVWAMPARPGLQAEEKPAKVVVLSGPAESLAVSPNGSRVAVAVGAKPKNEAEAAAPSLIQVFDPASGQAVMAFSDHTGPVRTLAFQPDNRTLLSSSADHSARLFDVNLIATMDAHHGGVAALACPASGAQLLSGGTDKTIKLWDLATRKVIRTFGPPAEPVHALCCSRDFTLAGAAAGKVAMIWNVADARQVRALSHPAEVLALSFSADRTRLVTGAADNLVRVWDLATGQQLQAFSAGGPVHAVACHPSSTAIVSGSDDKAILVQTPSVVRAIAAGTAPVRGLAVTPAGTHVLTAGADKTVKLWNIGNGVAERTFTGADDAVIAVSVSRNGLLVAAGGADRNVRVYSFADSRLLKALPALGAVQGLAFSPNSQTLAAACDSKSVQTWDVAYNPGQPISAEFARPGQLFEHAAPATGVSFAPDSSSLYSSGLDKTIEKWRFAAESPTRNFAHPNLVDAVAYNPSGTQLATACHDGSVRVWELARGQLLKEIKAHTMPQPNPVYCLAWSPDGKQLVSGSLDRSLKLWDATTGALVREFRGYKEKEFEKGHTDGVFCVAFSPDGKSLASGSSDHCVKIWNVSDGSVVRDCINPNLKAGETPGVLPAAPAAHPEWVYGVRYTADGKYLVSAGNAAHNQGYLAVWDAASGKMLYGEALPLGPIYALALAPGDKRLALGCGPQGRELADAQGYILKMPELGGK